MQWPDIGLGFAKRVKRSPDSGSPDGAGAREIYSSESVPTAETVMKSLTK